MTARATPPLGLLLDVDGPIASPESRSIAIPSIISDLILLAERGVPIGFITGRSREFMVNEVVAPLREHGLSRDAHVFGVCEKGAVWFPITADGIGEVGIDRGLVLPEAVVAAIRRLVASDFSATMFFDETKEVMVSVEQRTDVDNATYRRAQVDFDEAVTALLRQHDVGVRVGQAEHPDAHGQVTYRLDSSVIATDVESVTLDKAAGAARCLDYFGGRGATPHVWRSVGDSPGDYRMADHVHEAGHDAAHVDVNPGGQTLERPYPVITIDGATYDSAGARFLARCVREYAAG